MNSAPSAHSPVGKPKLSFDFAKGVFKPFVVLFDKLLKFGFVRNLVSVSHFKSSVVNRISIVDYNGYVFNLEVDGDNSYVANGFVTHNCRSVRVPIVDPKLRIPGLDGASQRASMTGPVSAKLTYDGFLRRQSAEFQNEVLGVERAKLFRSGMPIDKFTDASGKTYTLAELKAIDSLNTVQ